MNIVAGAYEAYWAPWVSGSPSFVHLGTLTNDGFREVENIVNNEITSGITGEVVVDEITGGSQGMELSFVLQELDTAVVRTLLKPWFYDTDLGFTQGTGQKIHEGVVAPAGLVASKTNGFLKLKPISGTSAATVASSTTDVTRYYKSVGLANGSSIEKQLSYRERFIAVKLKVLPYLDSNNVLRFWEYASNTI